MGSGRGRVRPAGHWCTDVPGFRILAYGECWCARRPPLEALGAVRVASHVLLGVLRLLARRSARPVRELAAAGARSIGVHLRVCPEIAAIIPILHYVRRRCVQAPLRWPRMVKWRRIAVLH